VDRRIAVVLHQPASIDMADEKDKTVIISTAPGVMGDGTEEQNLGQPGDPSKRITREEVEEAFGEKKDQDREAVSDGLSPVGSAPATGAAAGTRYCASGPRRSVGPW
jgi:hypothetical protein